MKILTGYDGIEVLNNYRTSIDHWDAALSNGNYVTILADDDAHDISDPNEIGHHCTFINSPTVKKEDIIASLRTGKSFGAKIWRPLGESIEEKIKRTAILPQLLSCDVSNDTLFIKMDSIIPEIRFIGQEGKILKSSENTTMAWYAIQKSDTYVRTEIHYAHGSVFYLNPVCRYNGSSPTKIPAPEINLWKTWLLRIVGFATLLFLIINVFILRKKFRK